MTPWMSRENAVLAIAFLSLVLSGRSLYVAHTTGEDARTATLEARIAETDYAISVDRDWTMELSARAEAFTPTEIRVTPYFDVPGRFSSDDRMGETLVYENLEETSRGDRLVLHIEDLRSDICQVGRNRDLCDDHDIDDLRVQYFFADTNRIERAAPPVPGS